MELILLFIIGVIMPPVVSYLKKVSWPKEAKLLTSMGVAFALASAVMAVRGDFGSVSEYFEKVSLVWATSQLVYVTWFGKLPINKTLELK
jgi:hypothetical protein